MAYWLRAQDYGRTTLSEAVDADDTTLRAPLADHGRFPAASAGDNNFIITLWDSSSYRTPLEAFEADDLEQVLVNSNGIGLDPGTGAPVITSMTVTRGYGGTTPQAWPAGTAMWLCDNAAVISEIQAALDAHTHTGGAQKVGASALTPESVDAAGHIAAATHLTAQTYLQVGAYLKGYNDASALYSGATGGVLELTQGAPSGATARSKVLMWCRDGIVGGVQMGIGPVHANADASFYMALLPKGTPAGGTAFTLCGNGAVTRWANFYCTTTDVGIAAQTGITTLSFRNGHNVTDTLALQLDLATSLLTFRGDAIVGRGAANRIDIGTSGAPDDLMVWGSKIEVGTTVRINRDQNNSLGLAAGDQIWADNTLILARSNLAERIYDICGQEHIRALWIPDGRTGTLLKDWSGNNRAATIGTSLTTIVDGHCRYLPTTADTHWWEIADADWLSFGNGTTDTAFTILALCNPTVAVGTTSIRTLFGRWNLQTPLREYLFHYTGFHLIFQCADQSRGGTIGRQTDAPPTGDVWQVLEASYDGGGSAAGMSIFVNGVRMDTTTISAGSYTAMANLALPAGNFFTGSGGTRGVFRGRYGMALLLAGQLTAAQRARLHLILRGFAGTSPV